MLNLLSRDVHSCSFCHHQHPDQTLALGPVDPCLTTNILARL